MVPFFCPKKVFVNVLMREDNRALGILSRRYRMFWAILSISLVA